MRSHEPVDAATLSAALYPTHTDYVAAVREVVRAKLAAGYIVEHDAVETIEQAELSDRGRSRGLKERRRTRCENGEPDRMAGRRTPYGIHPMGRTRPIPPNAPSRLRFPNI